MRSGSITIVWRCELAWRRLRSFSYYQSWYGRTPMRRSRLSGRQQNVRAYRQDLAQRVDHAMLLFGSEVGIHG